MTATTPDPSRPDPAAPDPGLPDPGSIFVDYRPHRRRRRVVLVGIGLAVLLVAGVSAVRANVSSPESAVEAYFDALADRDAGAALGMVAPDIADRLDRDLIADSVLRSEDYTPPQEVEVGGVTMDGDTAAAEVGYVIDGRRHEVSLQLRREEGLLDTLAPRWRVVDGVGSLVFGTAPAEVTVNGEPVPAHDAQGSRILPALPGVYWISAPEGDPLWDVRATPARVVPKEATNVDVPMAARPEVRAQVEAEVTQRLDRCAASTELLPPACPFGNARIAQAEDVAWRITEYPTVAVSAQPDESGQVAMQVHSSTDGEAVVTGTQIAFGLRRPFEIEVVFPISGSVTAGDDGSVSFRPGW